MSIRPPESATSSVRRNVIRVRSAAGVAFRLAWPAIDSGGRNLISGHGSYVIAVPTNEVTPTNTSDELRGMKRAPLLIAVGVISLVGVAARKFYPPRPLMRLRPPYTSDRPRKTKRDPHAAHDAKIALMGHLNLAIQQLHV